MRRDRKERNKEKRKTRISNKKNSLYGNMARKIVYLRNL